MNYVTQESVAILPHCTLVQFSKTPSEQFIMAQTDTLMLVTDIVDEMCWCQLLDVGDGSAILFTNNHYLCTCVGLNIQKLSPTLCHQQCHRPK